jgi:hypothetical protein
MAGRRGTGARGAGAPALGGVAALAIILLAGGAAEGPMSARPFR